MKKILLFLLFIFITISLFSFEIGIVERVVDGDTLKVLINNEVITIRLLGVDTPESVHPTKPVEEGAIEASNFTKQLEEKIIIVTYDEDNKKDFFGRTLGYIWIENDKGRLICWNLYLIQEGYGKLYTQYPFSLSEYFKIQLK
jgi:micrococcal nuclease